MSRRKTINAIENHGILLVYPIDNSEEPKSIWSVLYPGEKMRWEWDDEGDDRVANLWHLKTELASSREVVYAKWFRGRATFFSRKIFAAILSAVQISAGGRNLVQNREAKQILEVLEMESPQSTKAIKLATELRGKFFESTYEKAMKELWAKFLIVGFGEVEDGAFPSLAVGATQTLFEDLWEESLGLNPKISLQFIEEKLSEGSAFFKYFLKTLALQKSFQKSL